MSQTIYKIFNCFPLLYLLIWKCGCKTTLIHISIRIVLYKIPIHPSHSFIHPSIHPPIHLMIPEPTVHTCLSIHLFHPSIHSFIPPSSSQNTPLLPRSLTCLLPNFITSYQNAINQTIIMKRPWKPTKNLTAATAAYANTHSAPSASSDSSAADSYPSSPPPPKPSRL